MSVYVSVKGLRRSYGRRELFGGLDFTAGPGSVLAITGRNGSGKTTLLEIAGGLRRADSGTVCWRLDSPDGPEAKPEVYIALASAAVGFEPQATGRENLVFVARCCGVAVSDMLEQACFFGLGNDLDRYYRTYSEGMRQRLRLCAAFGSRRPLLLLDEPGLALDEQGHELLRGLLAQPEKSRTVIIATNDGRESELATENVHLG